MQVPTTSTPLPYGRYCHYLLRRWSEVITCLVCMSVGMFLVCSYAMDVKTPFSVGVACVVGVLFAFWLNDSAARAQEFETMQDYGTLQFGYGSISYYNYLDNQLFSVQYTDIERIEITPALTDDDDSQNPLEETYWIITDTDGQQMAVSSLAENAWQLTDAFSTHLGGFSAKQALVALMSTRGIGVVVWKRPRQQRPKLSMIDGTSKSQKIL